MTFAVTCHSFHHILFNMAQLNVVVIFKISCLVKPNKLDPFLRQCHKTRLIF